MDIGGVIKRLRLLRGFPQKDLAEHLGISSQGLGRIESGETDLPFSRLMQIANFFDLTPSELLSYRITDDGVMADPTPSKRESELQIRLRDLTAEVDQLKSQLRDKERIILLQNEMKKVF